MKTTSLNRFTPLPLRGGRRLANRIVVPAMASATAELNGEATQRTVEHYRRLAQSGAGLVLAEYTYAADEGKSELNQLGVSRDSHVGGLRRVADAVHETGALAGLQLTHAGGKTTPDFTGGRVVGPSAVAVPVRDKEMPVPQAVTPAEIRRWKEDFISAVGRAALAGFDLVEFHAAHGYGLNQWLSPITNRREDEYGGSPPRNARLLLELVTEARHRFPALLVAVRMPGRDFLEGGLETSDAVWLARRLEAAGVDILDVSSGIGGWRRPPARLGEGYLVDEATAIQSTVAVPVIGVGGIESGSYIDACLKEGRLSLAAVGRAILKDPAAWAQRNLTQ